MNGKILLDTNAILYLMKGDKCMIPLLNNKILVSIISEMELLSFSRITLNEDVQIRNFLKMCKILNVNRRIKEQTILLRKNII